MNVTLILENYITNINSIGTYTYGQISGKGSYNIAGESVEFFIAMPRVNYYEMNSEPNNPKPMPAKPGWMMSKISSVPYSKYGGKALFIEWKTISEKTENNVLNYLNYNK